MERDEIVYRTRLDLERTLVSLKEIPGLRIVYEKSEERPRGIAQLYWKGKAGEVSCQFGSKGGINVRFQSLEDHDDLVQLLQSRGLYRDGDHSWVKVKETHGRASYLTAARKAADLALKVQFALFETLLGQMHRLEAWNLVLNPTLTEEDYRDLNDGTVDNTLIFNPSTKGIIDLSTRDWKQPSDIPDNMEITRSMDDQIKLIIEKSRDGQSPAFTLN